MTKEQMIAICDALVSITEHECCMYGFEDEVGDAIEFLNENCTNSEYKEE